MLCLACQTCPHLLSAAPSALCVLCPCLCTMNRAKLPSAHFSFVRNHPSITIWFTWCFCPCTSSSSRTPLSLFASCGAFPHACAPQAAHSWFVSPLSSDNLHFESILRMQGILPILPHCQGSTNRTGTVNFKKPIWNTVKILPMDLWAPR